MGNSSLAELSITRNQNEFYASVEFIHKNEKISDGKLGCELK